MYKEGIQDVERRYIGCIKKLYRMYTEEIGCIQSYPGCIKKVYRMYKEVIQDVYRRNRMYNKGIQDVQRSYIGCIKKDQDVLQYNKGIQNV